MDTRFVLSYKDKASGQLKKVNLQGRVDLYQAIRNAGYAPSA